MAHYKISKGLSLQVLGSAVKNLTKKSQPRTVSIRPTDFKSMVPKLLKREGEVVKGGEPIFFNKLNEKVKFVSPVPGKVTKVHYGARRALLAIDIEADYSGEYVKHTTDGSVKNLSREALVDLLSESGLFTFIRQRPYTKVPDPSIAPKAIFVNGMDTAPNAGDQEFVLKDRLSDLQLGLEALGKLTEGKVHFCSASESQEKLFDKVTSVEKHTFSGPHPSGLVGTHIHFIDPINTGHVVWYITAVDAARIGTFLKKGEFSPEKVFCVAGTGVEGKYVQSVIGAPVAEVIGNIPEGDIRLINGTVLFGDHVTPDGYTSYYDTNLQVIKEGRERFFFGWMTPGFKRFSETTRTCLSALLPKKLREFNTNLNGGVRAIVWTEVYDKYTPLDIYTNFLLRAALANNIEDVEKLGIYEVAEEDFALATYVCPSKVDVARIIGDCLDTLDKENM